MTKVQLNYHKDHLGSTTLITNKSGEVVQRVEYLPTGETFIEQQDTSWVSPYKFNGRSALRYAFRAKRGKKELDEETGLYYYGSRYYDTRFCVWVSVDPLSNHYPAKTPYSFLSNNPISRIDPNGLWDIDVHAYHDREKSGYAIFILRDRTGNELYRTVVKTIGVGGRIRNISNSDTPQGQYRILGYRKTGQGTHYKRISYGPNDLLALEYQGGEGADRLGMHVHGGRQEGKYVGRLDLASTQGCMRINDDDMLQLKEITDNLEKQDPLEKRGVLTLIDDLINPVVYTVTSERHYAGLDQYPIQERNQTTISSHPVFPVEIIPNDNTRVYNPYKEVYHE